MIRTSRKTVPGWVGKGHGRLPSSDPRNEAFGAETPGNLPMLAGSTARKVTLQLTWHGDQGDKPQCAGFTGKEYLETKPKRVGRARLTPEGIYQGAQMCDEWAGEGYDGTSVLGVAKFLTQHPAIDVKSYYWAKNAGTLSRWLRSADATAIMMGTNWYSSMYELDQEGIARISGYVTNGHAFSIIGDDLKRGLFLCQNHWGLSWSPLRLGRFYLEGEAVERLIQEDGEACIATKYPRPS